MKTSRFSDAQKAFILRQGDDGVPDAEICRKAGISQATYFNWKKKNAGLLPDEMRRPKQLGDENNRLKKVVADLTLDREMLQDVIRRNVWSALSLQGFGVATTPVCENASGLSRVDCCCSQAMMRCAHPVSK
jgi:putative transposase